MKQMASCLLLLISITVLAQDVYQQFIGKWKYNINGNQTSEFVFKKKNVVVIRKTTKTGALNKSVSDVEAKAFVDPEKSTLSISYFDTNFKMHNYRYSYRIVDNKSIELKDLSDSTAVAFVMTKD